MKPENAAKRNTFFDNLQKAGISSMEFYRLLRVAQQQAEFSKTTGGIASLPVQHKQVRETNARDQQKTDTLSDKDSTDSIAKYNEQKDNKTPVSKSGTLE